MNIDFVDSAKTGSRRGPRPLDRDEIPKFIHQDADSKICGPVCVAMALDCDPKIILPMMRSKGGDTRTKQLIMVLKNIMMLVVYIL